MRVDERFQMLIHHRERITALYRQVVQLAIVNAERHLAISFGTRSAGLAKSELE